MNDFKSIVVAQGKPVIIKTNPTKYPLIGRGQQGAVFKLSKDRCVKIYSKEKYCLRESAVLQKVAQDSNIIPEIYEVGRNYIIMEYLYGPSLQEYLKTTSSIPEHLIMQIIYLIKEIKRLNFPRIDFALRHTIFDKHGKLKIIDHVNSFQYKRSYPKRLLSDLKELGFLSSFLGKVKAIEPELYGKWKKTLDSYL